MATKEQFVPTSYYAFDREVRIFLQESMTREHALRTIATSLLREWTTVDAALSSNSHLVLTNGQTLKDRINYDKVLLDMVGEIIVDELGRES